jgi:erythromycin esterase
VAEKEKNYMSLSFAKVTFDTEQAVKIIRQKGITLNSKNDLDPLIERISNARIVMHGEASHGIHEYYTRPVI